MHAVQHAARSPTRILNVLARPTAIVSACPRRQASASGLLSHAVVRGSLVFVLLLVGVAGVHAAPVDLSGSYSGDLQLARSTESTPVAAALTEVQGALSGTIALQTADASLSGAYLVQGKHKRKRVRLRGTGVGGATLVLRGKATDGGVRGRVKIKIGGSKARGRIVLTRLGGGGGDGSSCDGVFTDNEAFFTNDVMNGVLVPICSACHVEGGQAAATRLRVTPGDPAATARTTTLVIDPLSPADSLLLAKPLARVPHGGGQQITDGSAAATALGDWAALVAGTECAVSQPTTGPELYAANCASCHGADGAGLDGRPDLRCTVPERITDAVRLGRGSADTGMPAFTMAQLPAEQLDLIIEFLASLCSGAPGDVYASNCATCHGDGASGGRNADGVDGPDIRCKDPGDFPDVLAYGEERMPAFPTFTRAAALAIANYVNGLCTEGLER